MKELSTIRLYLLGWATRFGTAAASIWIPCRTCRASPQVESLRRCSNDGGPLLRSKKAAPNIETPIGGGAPEALCWELLRPCLVPTLKLPDAKAIWEASSAGGAGADLVERAGR